MRNASTQRLGAAPRNTFLRRTACLGLLAVTVALALAAIAHAYVPGAPVWLRTYGALNHAASCWAVAAGPDGSIVETGWTEVTPAQHDDILVLKFDAAGHRKFTQTFSGRRNGNDAGQSVAVDRWGNVYVAGVLWVSSTNTDLVLLKYGPTGKRLWVQTYDGPAHGLDVNAVLVVDSLGNAYLAGDSGVTYGNHMGIALVKFDAKGHRKWVTRIDPPKSSPNNDEDHVGDIALDAAGNPYLCGTSVFTVSSTDYYGALTYKFDANGRKKWAQVFYAKNPSARVSGNAIAVRGARVAVAGRLWRTSDSSDYLVLSYDLAGHAKYAFTYHSKINKADWADDVALDANLNAYVTGNASTGTVSSWGEGFMTLKLDPRGRLQWGRLLGEGEGYHVVTDTAGNAYVTGYFGGGPGQEWATAKYSPRGYRRWLRTWVGKGTSYADPSDIVLGGANGVFVGGEGYGVSGANTFSEAALIRYNR